MTTLIQQRQGLTTLILHRHRSRHRTASTPNRCRSPLRRLARPIRGEQRCCATSQSDCQTVESRIARATCECRCSASNGILVATPSCGRLAARASRDGGGSSPRALCQRTWPTRRPSRQQPPHMQHRRLHHVHCRLHRQQPPPMQHQCAMALHLKVGQWLATHVCMALSCPRASLGGGGNGMDTRQHLSLPTGAIRWALANTFPFPSGWTPAIRWARTRTHAHARARARTRTRAHTHAHERTRARARTRTHARARARARARTCTHAHAHAHARARTRTRTHTHTHARAHARARARTRAHARTRTRTQSPAWKPGAGSGAMPPRRS